MALALACAPVAHGYFDLTLWAPLALGALVVLVVIVATGDASLTLPAAIAGTGLGLLLALSAASIAWAESRERAWSATGRLTLYAAAFAIGALGVRDRRTGRVVVVTLAAGSLVTSVWLCGRMLGGDVQTAFLTHRLNEPIGYINGTAGLLVMGVWPWIACAESAAGRRARAASLAAATLVAATMVLTQSRALVPAVVVSVAVALTCAPGRRIRGCNLAILAAGVALSLPWTLPVYISAGDPAAAGAPGDATLRAAGIAILVAAIGAGLIRLAVGSVAARAAPALGARTLSWATRGLATASVLGLIVATAVAVPWLGREYRAFTALRVNQNASVRFVDASGYRYDLWRVAVREFKSHPVAGLGAGNYDTEYYRLRHTPEYVVQPHSLELQMAAELGVGGIVALLLFCGGTLWAAFARRGTVPSDDRLIRIAAVGIFTAWLAHTSVDWLYDIPGVTAMAMLAAGMLAAPRRAAAGGRSQSRRLAAAKVIALVVVAMLAAGLGRQLAAVHYSDAGAKQVAQRPRAALASLRRATQLDPFSLGTLYSVAAAFARQHDYRRARAALLLAAAREPHNYVPPALLGDLAMRRRVYGEALAQYRRALALNPRDVALRQAERSALRSRR